jgi:hypothetical protein
MKVIGLDGRTYNMDLKGHVPLGGDRNGSGPHERAKILLDKLFPCDTILEEVTLPGTKSLRADFFLPRKKIVLEANGEQHYYFTPLFHGTQLGFIRSQQRDRQKAEWCELNGIRHIELPHFESERQWRERIVGTGTGEGGSEREVEGEDRG